MSFDCSKQLEKFLKAHNLYEFKTEYSCISVIGCQSSGKSTLLNRLFDTKFETMDDQRGRQQTTKGIWMSQNVNENGKNLNLVFDIEGTDSKERGD